MNEFFFKSLLVIRIIIHIVYAIQLTILLYRSLKYTLCTVGSVVQFRFNYLWAGCSLDAIGCFDYFSTYCDVLFYFILELL